MHSISRCGLSSLVKVNPEQYLNSLINYETTPGYDYDLNAFRALCEQLGSPHTRLKNVIHIAGTKGKGSVAAVLGACLAAHGYKVGMFTSPHLARVNERIKVNGQEISDSQLNRYLQKIRSQIDLIPVTRTYFEVLTACAFLHFIACRTDFSILEVGLGGRIDSTNIAFPLVSVITRIGYDHTNLLGRTLNTIAAEKAGIIKENTQLITIHQRPAVNAVLHRVARARSAPISYADDAHSISIADRSLRGSNIRIRSPLGNFNAFLQIAGDHQIENLKLCLSVLRFLKDKGFSVNARLIKKGCGQVKLHGRTETISKKPLILFDCAHNEDSFKALNRYLQRMHLKRFIIIFGSSTGKDFRYCFKHILPKAQAALLVRAPHPRAVNPLILYAQARHYQKNCTICNTVQAALAYAQTLSPPEPVIITGSFYLWQNAWRKA
jgi:dihydrofolate synthase/folylpolyglutamate synthase